MGQGNRMKESGSSFRQGMPESSAMEGNLSVVRLHDLSIAVDHDLPSMHDGPSASSGQDFGIPRHSLTGAGSAKMTCLYILNLIAMARCEETRTLWLRPYRLGAGFQLLGFGDAV